MQPWAAHSPLGGSVIYRCHPAPVFVLDRRPSLHPRQVWQARLSCAPKRAPRDEKGSLCSLYTSAWCVAQTSRATGSSALSYHSPVLEAPRKSLDLKNPGPGPRTGLDCPCPGQGAPALRTQWPRLVMRLVGSLVLEGLGVLARALSSSRRILCMVWTLTSPQPPAVSQRDGVYSFPCREQEHGFLAVCLSSGTVVLQAGPPATAAAPGSLLGMQTLGHLQATEPETLRQRPAICVLTSSLFSFTAGTNQDIFSDLNNVSLLHYNFVGQKSALAHTRLQSNCQQRCAVSEPWGESAPVLSRLLEAPTFLGSWPFLQLQGQRRASQSSSNVTSPPDLLRGPCN